MVAYWRRVLQGNAGLDLTLAEAAALLGISVGSLRRRIKRGEIQARRDDRGRLRVVPVVGAGEAAFIEAGTPQPSSVSELWEQLKAAWRDLADARSENDAISLELERANDALRWAQDELAARGSAGLHAWPLGQSIDVPSQRRERVRIESKIDEVRKLAGRRSWLDAIFPG